MCANISTFPSVNFQRYDFSDFQKYEFLIKQVIYNGHTTGGQQTVSPCTRVSNINAFRNMSQQYTFHSIDAQSGDSNVFIELENKRVLKGLCRRRLSVYQETIK